MQSIHGDNEPIKISANEFACTHMCNNDALGPQKMVQVLPIYTLLNVNRMKVSILHKKLSVDESVVPYFGRHSCRQSYANNSDGKVELVR